VIAKVQSVDAWSILVLAWASRKLEVCARVVLVLKIIITQNAPGFQRFSCSQAFRFLNPHVRCYVEKLECYPVLHRKSREKRRGQSRHLLIKWSPYSPWPGNDRLTDLILKYNDIGVTKFSHLTLVLPNVHPWSGSEIRRKNFSPPSPSYSVLPRPPPSLFLLLLTLLFSISLSLRPPSPSLPVWYPCPGDECQPGDDWLQVL
jgi:hypothetical protein